MAAEFDVRKVARLARLGLTPAEEERFSAEFAAILDFVARVQALPLEGVPASVHARPPALPLEDDAPRPGLSTEQALENAPETEQGFFRLPPILVTRPS